MQHESVIVIASRTEARVYQWLPGDKKLVPLETLENSLGRERNRAMETDKPGLSYAKFAGAMQPYSLTGEKNPHDQAALQFARLLADYLERKKDAHEFGHLTVVAEPHMLGQIRQFSKIKKLEPVEWVRKDLSKLATHELEARLTAQRL